VRRWAAVGGVVLAALLGACGTQAKPGSASGSAAGAPKEVLIGAVYPFSGSLASTGEDERKALDLAVDIINNAYPDLNLPLAKTAGLPNLGGAKVRVVYQDSAGSPEKAASATEQLITQDHVVAVIGSYASSNTATASQVAERHGVPFLNPESSAPSLTERGYQWFFRTSPTDDTFARNFFDFLNDLRRQGTVTAADTLALVYENTDFGTGTATAEKKYAQQFGYRVVADIPYSANGTDVSSEVQRLIAARPSIVLQASYTSDAILFTRTYKNLHFRPKAILAMDAGFTDPSYLKTVGTDAEGILSREVFASDLAKRKPIIGQVNALFRQRYGYDLNGVSARGLVGLLVLADAINRAGSTDPEAIRQALLATDIPGDQVPMPWQGVRFDPQTHQNVLGQGIVVQIQQGAYVTVWPSDVAPAQLVWPLPPIR
jgi:branched-chain amino acid transport system substrate-binding protein